MNNAANDAQQLRRAIRALALWSFAATALGFMGLSGFIFSAAREAVPPSLTLAGCALLAAGAVGWGCYRALTQIKRRLGRLEAVIEALGTPPNA